MKTTILHHLQNAEATLAATRIANLQINSIRPYPPAKIYRLIEPGPVLLVATGSLGKRTHNVMTIGFHMVIQHESPPLISISLGPWDASFAALKKQRECVLAVPSVEMAEVVVDIGNCFMDDEELKEPSKWERFGLEAFRAGKVKAPLVGGEHVIWRTLNALLRIPS